MAATTLLPSVTGSSIQPISILLINPNSTPSMTLSCLRSIESTLPPHVTVHGFTAPSIGPSAIEGRVDAVLSTADCLRALAPLLSRKTSTSTINTHTTAGNTTAAGEISSSEASPPKFDAFLVACFSKHPLIDALREEYTQPCIGIMEAALYASRMCGERLGIITTSPRSSRLHTRSIAEYGLSSYSAGCETASIAVLELESKPKAEVYAGLVAAAEKLVAGVETGGRGADCVCLGCAGMTEMQEVCKEAVGMDERRAMVVDGVAMGVHFLTGLVREGLGTPKGGVYSPASAGREKRGQDWL